MTQSSDRNRRTWEDIFRARASSESCVGLRGPPLLCRVRIWSGKERSRKNHLCCSSSRGYRNWKFAQRVKSKRKGETTKRTFLLILHPPVNFAPKPSLLLPPRGIADGGPEMELNQRAMDPAEEEERTGGRGGGGVVIPQFPSPGRRTEEEEEAPLTNHTFGTAAEPSSGEEGVVG